MTMNTSGLIPIDKRILVKPDEVEEKVGSLFLPETARDQKKMAQTLGTLVAVGETAWSEAISDARNAGLAFTAPKPGDRVVFPKYGGQVIEGPKDRQTYRLLNDEDLTGRLEE